MAVITLTTPNPSSQNINNWPSGNSWNMLQTMYNDLVTISGTTSSTTNSTSSTTGAFTTAGGVGIAQDLFVGGTINGKQTIDVAGGVFATPIQLTTAQSGKKIVVADAAGLAYLLPAIATADIGTWFEFFVTVSVTSNSFKVTSATGDLMAGSIYLSDDTAAYTAPQGIVQKPAGTFLIMTMNGTTSGGKIGTRVRFTATSATQWFVEGVANGSGNLSGAVFS